MPARRRLLSAAALFLSLLPAPAPAAAPPALPPVLENTLAQDRNLDAVARLAVGPSEPAARVARARLRAAGPAGLRAFERVYATDLDAAAAAILAAGDAPRERPDPAGLVLPGRARLLLALDEICGQRDCVLSRLYWHTDLDEAVRTARREGKPILSLRLLGDLREELSCANSRFFRAVLYPDPALTTLLRERFVLHWSSERPAPKIIIDLGDGNSVVTTITGNSAHFVLDPAGRPVDVIPGLYAPAAFATALTHAASIARTTATLTGDARRDALARHHAARLADLDLAWRRDLRALGERDRPAPRPRSGGAPAPRAGQAAPIAIAKISVEKPMLDLVGEPVASDPDGAWFERIAALHLPAVTLSRATLGLMRTQQFRSGDIARDALDLRSAQQGLRRDLALDTVRNEQEIHRAIHGWWIRGDAAPLDLDALSRRVYDALFLTPRSDPWLGLADPAVYGGLIGGGRRSQAHL